MREYTLLSWLKLPQSEHRALQPDLEREHPAHFELRKIATNCANALFGGLEQQDIDLISAAAKVRRFPIRSLMTRQDEPADRLFLLCKGRARYFFETSNGKKIILAWITPGHIFGASALATPPSLYLVGTEAVRETTVFVWDSQTIRVFAQRFPQVLQNVFLTSIDYLSWYVGTHAALASQTAEERLAHLLLGYAPSIGQKVKEGIELDVTNEELADAANVTPWTASRLISEWQRRGAIRKHRRKIVLLSAKKLFNDMH